MSKNSKYQTDKKSNKLTKNPNDQTGALKGGTFRIFQTSIVAKHHKIEGVPFGEKFLKSLTMREKTERGDPLGFFNIHSVAKHQTIEGGSFGGKNFFEKSLTMPKNVA